MTDYKVKRTPLLPPIPKEDEWQDFDRIERWRRSHLTVVKQLNEDTYDDIGTLSNKAIDTFGAPSDITTLNANSSTHGLCPKMSGTSTTYLSGAGSWTTPSGSHSAVTVNDTTTVNLAITAGQLLSADVIQANINHDSLANLTSGDPHTQYLKLNKSNQTLYANLTVDSGITIDTVDISVLSSNVSALTSNFNAHDSNTASNAHTNGIGNALGTWSATNTYVANSNYTASTDGIVVCTAHSSSISFFTPSNDAQYKTYAASYDPPNEQRLSITCPVKKNATWRFRTADGGSGVYIFFLPLGT